MSLVLNIDTANETASVCLSRDGKVLQFSASQNLKDHAAWLHTAITQQLQLSGYEPKDLHAIAVTMGPGSYTGIRVGLAAAKGFCYALQIPMIAVNSLHLLAFAVKDEASFLICPLIDARRMEVFTALYDKVLKVRLAPYALVLDEKSFADILFKDKVLFCGNGITKLQPLLSDSNARFSQTIADATQLAQMSIIYYKNKEFADLAYTEPVYVKEFMAISRGI